MLDDYYVICAVSPYYMLYPTDPSAWFIPGPGIAGKDDPSGHVQAGYRDPTMS